MTKRSLIGTLAPNIEDPKNEIRKWNDRPAPVGFGSICRHWEPRRKLAGTCDQEYLDNRFPLPPADLDHRFYLGSIPEFTFEDYLRGGEPVELRNLTPDGHLRFDLPRVVLGFQTKLAGQWINHVGKLATVTIEPDAMRLMLSWHTWLPCHRKKFALEITRVFEKKLIS